MIGCIAQLNKQYYILNVKVKEEEFYEYHRKILSDKKTYKEFFEQYSQLVATQPRKFSRIEVSENVTGDDIYNSSNLQVVFNSYESQNIRYSVNAWSCNDNMDCTNVG